MIYTNSKTKQSRWSRCRMPGSFYQREKEKQSDREQGEAGAPSRRAAASWASACSGPSPAPEPVSRADSEDHSRPEAVTNSAALSVLWRKFTGTSLRGTRKWQQTGRALSGDLAFLEIQSSFPACPASWRHFLFGGGMEQL